MTDVVFQYEGTLDKYVGDAITAIYGAPLDQADHPYRACRTALGMMERLRRLNEKWTAAGKQPLAVGIGIHTGVMMVGNMGSDQRFDYTVIGDAVNLGSRLEGANKVYGTDILISDSTHRRVHDMFSCMEIDVVRFKGKRVPVKIYQLLGLKEDSGLSDEMISLFQQGLELYRGQRWDEAIRAFERARSMAMNLPVADFYVRRCHGLKASPPGDGWDGVFTMDIK